MSAFTPIATEWRMCRDVGFGPIAVLGSLGSERGRRNLKAAVRTCGSLADLFTTRPTKRQNDPKDCSMRVTRRR